MDIPQFIRSPIDYVCFLALQLTQLSISFLIFNEENVPISSGYCRDEVTHLKYLANAWYLVSAQHIQFIIIVPNISKDFEVGKILTNSCNS